LLEEKRKRERHSSASIFIAWSVPLEAVLNVPKSRDDRHLAEKGEKIFIFR